MSTEIVSVICNSSLETLHLQCNPQVFGIMIAQAQNQISSLICTNLDDNITGVVGNQLAIAFFHWKIYDFETIFLLKDLEMTIFVQFYANFHQ